MKVSSTNVTMGKVSASLIKLGRQRIISGALVKSANHHDVLFAVRKDWRNTLDSGFFDFNSTNDIFVESPFAWMTNVLCISSSEAETMYTLQVEPVIALQKVAFKNQLNESNRDITDSNLLKPISQKLNFCFDPLTNDNVQHFMLPTFKAVGDYFKSNVKFASYSFSFNFRFNDTPFNALLKFVTVKNVTKTKGNFSLNRWVFSRKFREFWKFFNWSFPIYAKQIHQDHLDICLDDVEGRACGKKTYKRMYDRKKGVFPGGFGLTASGRGALGFRGLGRGGLNGIAGITGLNGAPRIALNIGGRALGLSDRLGNDLIGTYGLLSPAGLDDTAFGVIGDSFFNPGGIIGFGRRCSAGCSRLWTCLRSCVSR
ncbi:hypothetical protein TYRP_019347 [Tyrophagus putrescentiae]|nr:hypothetical protein TYRP_019347 [Tyrophagus putrescentiae]